LRLAAEAERLGERGGDAAGDRDRGGLAGQVAGDEDELVAAEPRDGVGRAQDAPQARGDLDEQAVAALVPEAVVDRLEAVDVEVQDRDRAALALALGQRLLEAFDEERAVRQTGERVGQRLAQALGLDAVALDRGRQDVGDAAQEARVAGGERARVLHPAGDDAERPVGAGDRDRERARDALARPDARRRQRPSVVKSSISTGPPWTSV
jgi:hypothetical protein